MKEKEEVAFYLVPCTSWYLYPDLTSQMVEKAAGIGTIEIQLLLHIPALSAFQLSALCLQRLLEVPAGCLLCSLTPGCPLLGVNESISHLREWRSQADAYAPSFCWEVREDVSLPFGSHILRETPSPFCQDNRSYTIPIYTYTAR